MRNTPPWGKLSRSSWLTTGQIFEKIFQNGGNVMNRLTTNDNSGEFIQEISTLIQSSKQRMEMAVNAELTLLYDAICINIF